MSNNKFIKNNNTKENVIEYLTEEKLHSKHLLEFLPNAMMEKLKQEDPATFCEVIAFLEEMEKKVKEIITRFGK